MPTGKIFIIHGRDMEALEELKKLVRSLHLDIIDFDSLSADLGPTAFIADIVTKGITVADAALVLFTPDEVAALHDPKTGRLSDENTEKRWQARPNVIFEAGIAFGSKPHSTFLITVGANVELFSDVQGIHIVRLNDAAGKARLHKKLKNVFPEIPDFSFSWAESKESGDFQSCQRKRWPYWDDLHEMSEQMKHAKPPKAVKTNLFKMVARVIKEVPNFNIERVSSQTFFSELVKRNPAKATADWAFWKLIYIGVFEFSDASEPSYVQWYDGDGDDYTEAVDYIEFTSRGRKLLHMIKSIS